MNKANKLNNMNYNMKYMTNNNAYKYNKIPYSQQTSLSNSYNTQAQSNQDNNISERLKIMNSFIPKSMREYNNKQNEDAISDLNIDAKEYIPQNEILKKKEEEIKKSKEKGIAKEKEKEKEEDEKEESNNKTNNENSNEQKKKSNLFKLLESMENENQKKKTKKK